MSLVTNPSGQTNFSSTIVPVVTLPTTTTNDAPYSITLSQSGSIIRIPIMPQAATLTLPLVTAAAGFNLKLQVSGVPAFIVRLDGGTGNINAMQCNDATWTSDNARRYHQFTAAAEVGDTIEIACDGVRYSSRGYSQNAAGIASANAA